jgi:hypothetical protein
MESTRRPEGALASSTPRRDRWREHFAWEDGGAVMRGLTARGRVTVASLDMNHAEIVAARRLWVVAGWHPLTDEGQSSA